MSTLADDLRKLTAHDHLLDDEERVRHLESRLRAIAKVMEWDAMKRPAPAITHEAHRVIRVLCGGIS